MSKPLVIISAFADEDIRTATLVFQTIRVGFPWSDIVCEYTGNPKHLPEIRSLCSKYDVTCATSHPFKTTNDIIISDRIQHHNGEVVFIDSDMIFWESVEDFKPSRLISGRVIPQYVCPYTKMTNIARVHPSFLWVKNCHFLRVQTTSPVSSRFVPNNIIKPAVVFDGGRWIFYDTCASLSNILGAQSFTEDMLNKYDHLFASTFVKEVAKETVELLHLPSLHNSIYNNPQLAKGMWKEQDKYFRQHKE